MRLNLFVLLAGIFMVFAPAMAGNVTVADGKLVWQSTQCTAPDTPGSVTTPPDRHAKADDANKRLITYNDYVQKAQAYMDCLSQEAQADSKIAGDAITSAAQQKIDDTKKSVADLGAPLQSKK